MKKRFIDRHKILITVDKLLWTMVVEKSKTNQISYNSMINILLQNAVNNHYLSYTNKDNKNNVIIKKRGVNFGKFHFEERYSTIDTHQYHCQISKKVWNIISEFSKMNKITYNLTINFLLEKALKEPIYLV